MYLVYVFAKIMMMRMMMMRVMIMRVMIMRVMIMRVMIIMMMMMGGDGYAELFRSIPVEGCAFKTAKIVTSGLGNCFYISVLVKAENNFNITTSCSVTVLFIHSKYSAV